MLVAVLLVLSSVGWLDLVSSNEVTVARSRFTYPDPRKTPELCRRSSESYICDPDQIIAPREANQLDARLKRLITETRCPCSHYSCSTHSEGYKIGIALTRKIQPGEEFSAKDRGGDESEERNKWLLDEAQQFALALLRRWGLGRCTEDVIIFYSFEDGVLYTAVGDVARIKLNHTIIREISASAGDYFGPNRDILGGLHQMTMDYRGVFFDAYHRRTPQTGASHGSGVESVKAAGHGAALLVASVFTAILTYLAS